MDTFGGTPPPQASGRSDRSRALLLLGGLLALYAGLLVGKPLHIDDPHYVEGARHLLQQPTRPLEHLFNWKTHLEPAYLDNNNPPFFLYALASGMAVLGDRPLAVDLVALGFVGLGLAATLAVARRFTPFPLLATALVFTSPVVPLSVNRMLDVPMLALGVTAVGLFAGGVDRGRPALSIAGATTAGLAVLTKYNALVLLPVLGLYAWLHGRVRHAWTLLVPLGMVGLWQLHTALAWGTPHLVLSQASHGAERAGAFHWITTSLSVAVALGSSLPFLGLTTVRPRDFWRGRAWWPAVACGLFLPPLLYRPESPVGVGYWWFAGAFLLLLLLSSRLPPVAVAPGAGLPLRSRLARAVDPDSLFLWGWVVAVVGFHLLVARHQSPRYHFLALAPLAFLATRALVEGGSRWRTAPAWAAVALQLPLAVLVAAADDVHARGDRALVVDVHRDLVARGRTATCIGHWGVQEACRQQGLPTLDLVRDSILPGDLFLVPWKSSAENLPPAFRPLPRGLRACEGGPLLRLVEERRYPYGTAPAASLGFRAALLESLYRRWPVSVMEESRGTSYYSARFPLVPYALPPLTEDPPAFGQRLAVVEARCAHDPAGPSFGLAVGDVTAPYHLPQGWAPSGRGGTFVWSVGERSLLRFLLAPRPQPYQLTLERHLAASHGRLEVGITVNGTSAGTLVFASGQALARLSLPARSLQPGPNHVVLQHRRTFVPVASSHGASWDARTLSLPLRSLRVEPRGQSR